MTYYTVILTDNGGRFVRDCGIERNEADRIAAIVRVAMRTPANTVSLEGETRYYPDDGTKWYAIDNLTLSAAHIIAVCVY